MFCFLEKGEGKEIYSRFFLPKYFFILTILFIFMSKKTIMIYILKNNQNETLFDTRSAAIAEFYAKTNYLKIYYRTASNREVILNDYSNGK